MKIKEINDEYYVFRRPGKVCMTVREFPLYSTTNGFSCPHEKKLVRADTGLLGDKYVPADVEKAIRRFQVNEAGKSLLKGMTKGV